jgi:hypothetical protein
MEHREYRLTSEEMRRRARAAQVSALSNLSSRVHRKPVIVEQPSREWPETQIVPLYQKRARVQQGKALQSMVVRMMRPRIPERSI